MSVERSALARGGRFHVILRISSLLVFQRRVGHASPLSKWRSVRLQHNYQWHRESERDAARKVAYHCTNGTTAKF